MIMTISKEIQPVFINQDPIQPAEDPMTSLILVVPCEEIARVLKFIQVAVIYTSYEVLNLIFSNRQSTKSFLHIKDHIKITSYNPRCLINPCIPVTEFKPKENS